jgi:hypothetical protein
LLRCGGSLFLSLSNLLEVEDTGHTNKLVNLNLIEIRSFIFLKEKGWRQIVYPNRGSDNSALPIFVSSRVKKKIVNLVFQGKISVGVK